MTTTLKTGLSARRSARDALTTTANPNVAPGYTQCHLMIMPGTQARDFRLLCLRNPVALPLMGENHGSGVYDQVKSRVPWLEDDDVVSHGAGCDLRADAPCYDVYRDGKLVEEGVHDVKGVWADGSVAFLVGGERGVERALEGAGFEGVDRAPVTPLYKTRKTLLPSGVFYDSTYVVSMRVFKAAEVGKVREVCAPYAFGHGEPIDWGWGAIDRLGIEDIDRPEWGDAPLAADGSRKLGEVAWGDEEVPVFWASGRTMLEAVQKAEIVGDVAINSHGCMVVLDCLDRDLLRERLI